jgi:DNA-binding NarL/FixJ family response regulator
VVDDYEPFRRFISSTLRKRAELQIVGEASDGLEAVHKVEELHPDLIVLDLGLPTLNGIEAARRIRKLSPESKILFVSQESSTDVVQEALSLGALGYVIKTHAGSELLDAVDAVRKGKQFISEGLSAPPLTDNTNAKGSGVLNPEEAIPSLGPRRGDIPRRHEVEFYSDDASFLVGFTRFIQPALLAGNAVIVVATESHQKSLLQMVEERGVNIAAAIEEGRYLALDVAETLSTFMVNDRPDPARFLKSAGKVVATAAKAAKGLPPRVAACGECAPVLWAQGNADAAIEVEHLWDGIAETCGVDILCGYVLTDFQSEQQRHIRSRICAEHTAVWSQ